MRFLVNFIEYMFTYELGIAWLAHPVLQKRAQQTNTIPHQTHERIVRW